MLYDSVYRGWIGGVEVSSPTLYVVYGKPRGLILGTDLIEEAREALRKELELCRQQGFESDAEIYQWDYYYRNWKRLRWERRLLEVQ